MTCDHCQDNGSRFCGSCSGNGCGLCHNTGTVPCEVCMDRERCQDCGKVLDLDELRDGFGLCAVCSDERDEATLIDEPLTLEDLE